MDVVTLGAALSIMKKMPDTAASSAAAAEDAADRAEAAAQTLVIDSTLTHSGQAADAKVVGDKIDETKTAFSNFLNGTPVEANVLTNAALVKGNYNIGDSLSVPTTSDYRKSYNIGFELSGDITFISETDGLFNVCFVAFDANDECISNATVWLSDGTYTASQIKNNAKSASGTKYTFQIKKVNGERIDETINASDYFSLIALVDQKIPTASIMDDAVTEEKLSAELREKINQAIPSPADEEMLDDGVMIYNAYALGDTLDNPSTGKPYYRESYPGGFVLTNDLIFTSNTNGEYNISFVAFDSEGICISTPAVWLSDGSYSAADIMANARNAGGAKYTFTIKKITGDGIEDALNVRDYFSLKSAEKYIGIVDVIMFMGQSNMAGRGEVANAPALLDGAGYEYRAISAPNTLTVMAEPFGATENNPSGINEGSSKTGSMVVAFTNAYFSHNGKIPVVGISASKGGTAISDWQPNGAYLTDAIARLSSCITYLEANDYTIRHKYILWCQGETDGDNNTTAEDYKTLFNAMLAEMMSHGIEKLFLVRIGNHNSGSSTRYETIMDCQTEIAQTETDVVMASTDFAGMRARNLMKDQFHYYQAAYNEVGTFAGINVAFYANSGKEPTMYDTQDNTLYFSHKN